MLNHNYRFILSQVIDNKNEFVFFGILARITAVAIERAGMKITEIQYKIAENDYFHTVHADFERKADKLTLLQVEMALLNGEILENYPDTGRGESCLIVGFADDLPIHIVCG